MVLGVAVAGCSGASWKNVEIDESYQRPSALTVTVIASRGSHEVAAELADALVTELRRHRIQATLVRPMTDAADVSVTIVKFDEGDRFMRWLAFAGEGETVVVVEALSIGVEGKARGEVWGGWFGGAAENSAAAAGRLIGRTIATGRAWSVDKPERRQQ